MATGGVSDNSSPGFNDSMKSAALEMLNLFQCDIPQPLSENQDGANVSGQERMEDPGTDHGDRGNDQHRDQLDHETDQSSVQESGQATGQLSGQAAAQATDNENGQGNVRGTDQASGQAVGEAAQENNGIGNDQVTDQASGQAVGEAAQANDTQNDQVTEQATAQASAQATDQNDQQNQPVNLLTQASIQEIIHKAVGVLVKAIDADKQNTTREAFNLYKNALELLMVAFKDPSVNGRTKQVLRAKIHMFLTRTEQLKDKLQNKSSDCQLKKHISTERMEINNFFERFILDDSSKRNLDDVKGHGETLHSLKEHLILPLKYPQLFVGRFSRSLKNILFFGHPGTGKTMMMSAIATELPNFNFMRLSVWDLTSRFWGQNPHKAVRELFQFAIEKTHCIVCIDDIDVIDKEIDDENEWRQIKTEFLVQFVERSTKSKTLEENLSAVLCVTQKPWCLSAPLRRRFNTKIFFNLPTKSDRMEILKSGLEGVRHKLTADNFDQLADRTISAGGCRLTQADLVCLCRDAMMQSVRKIQQAKFFKQVLHPETQEGGFWTPCCQGDDSATEMSWTELDWQKLLEPEIEMDDFLESLKKWKGTIDSESEARMQQWMEDYVL